MKYCSNCAQPVIFKKFEGDHLHRFFCESCETIHYQNPRVIVGCLPIYDDKILLCRRGIEPQLGFWNIPGGFMENGETVEEGALREAKEEANLSASIEKMISVYTVPKINQVHLHFLVNVHESNWHLTSETTEIKLFALDEIPWDEIAFPSNIFALETYLQNIISNDWNIKIGSFSGEMFF